MSRLTMFFLSVVLVAFALPMTANAAKNGTYVGKDSGKGKVVLKIKNNRVVKFTANPSGTCNGRFMLVAFAFPSLDRPKAKAKIKKNGTFKVIFKTSKDVSFAESSRTLSGLVRGNRITGVIKAEGLCQATASFKVTRKK